MAKIKPLSIFFMLLFFPVHGLAADAFDILRFEKHIKLIHESKESDYTAQLVALFAKAKKDEGASIESIITISRKVGISDADVMTAAIQNYPAENVITELIKSSKNAEAIIKMAVFLDIDPRKIITGAIAAGVKPVDAEVMVAVAMKLKKEQGTGNSIDEGDKTGLALTPGEELDNGGTVGGAAGAAGAAGGPAGGAAGPVGGSGGGGIASPS
jgi:hypothetical protein